MKEIDELRQQVAESRTVTESAAALIRGLKERLDLALEGGDAVQALREIRDDLNRQEESLARAVSENTPAAGDETGGGTTDPGTGTGGIPEGGDIGAGGTSGDNTGAGGESGTDPDASGVTSRRAGR